MLRTQDTPDPQKSYRSVRALVTSWAESRYPALRRPGIEPAYENVYLLFTEILAK